MSLSLVGDMSAQPVMLTPKLAKYGNNKTFSVAMSVEWKLFPRKMAAATAGN